MTDLLATASAELLSWARTEFGADVTLQAPTTPLPTGMDTVVGSLTLSGRGLAPTWSQPLVLRVHRSAASEATAQREAAVQTWCESRGFPVPRMLFVGSVDAGFTTPLQVMTTAPGTTALAALTRRPWRARTLLAKVARLHARLHRLAPSGFPAATLPMAAAKIAIARPWCDTIGEPGLGRALEHVETLAPELDTAPRSVCHGDYHPLNVMVDGDDLVVLDWTDAVVGDPMGDLARSTSLFRVAQVAAENATLRRLLRAIGPWLAATYLAAYRDAAEIDETRLARWRSVHLFHGWAQVAALHAGLIGTDTDRSRIPVSMTAWLQREYERSIDGQPT